MLYSFSVIREIRERDSIRRRDLAGLLGISEHYLYMIENGYRQPSADLIARIAKTVNVPVETFMSVREKSDAELGEETIADNGLRALTDLQNKLDRERHVRRESDKRNLELEWTVEHLASLITLHVRFEDIMCQQSVSMAEKMRLLEKLARAIAHEGAFTFSEMLTVFRVKRSILKRWLDMGKQAYRCRFDEGRTVMADTPGEAALRLLCFDCGEFENGECRGYGSEKRPEHLIMLLVRMEINGIYNKTEQSQLLAEGYGIELTPHEISEIAYKYKNGLRVPEDAFYLDMSRKKD
jgi:transcriptional regulator with XRE-family HTH domain